jgi:hypothetical protein
VVTLKHVNFKDEDLWNVVHAETARSSETFGKSKLTEENKISLNDSSVMSNEPPSSSS